jgi:hypothetical protein
MLFICGEEVFSVEQNDISAEKTAKIESSWIPGQNEIFWWQKGFGRKKGKRKKSLISLGHWIVVFY